MSFPCSWEKYHLRAKEYPDNINIASYECIQKRFPLPLFGCGAVSVAVSG